MAYYTQFKFKAKLKEVPKQLDQFLNNTDNYLESLWGKEVPKEFSVYSHPEFPIKHEFGKCTRWFALLYNGTLIENILTINSEFKNYDNEIEIFRDWVKPYIEEIYQDEDIYIG